MTVKNSGIPPFTGKRSCLLKAFIPDAAISSLASDFLREGLMACKIAGLR